MIDMYAASAAAVALLMDALIGWFTNNDDLINRGKVVFTRKALEEMLKAQPPTIFSHIVLDGADRGEYSAGKYQVDFVVERPTASIVDYYWMTVDQDWRARDRLPTPNCEHASVVTFNGQLQAVLTRRDGMMAYMKFVDGKWSWPRVIPGALTRSYNTPSLTVQDGCLWVAYKDPDHKPRLVRTYNAHGVDWEWTNMWTGENAPTPEHVYDIYSGPAVAWFRDKFYIAWRVGSQDHQPGQRDAVDVWTWDHRSGKQMVRVKGHRKYDFEWRTEDAPRLVVFRDFLFVFIRCKDNYVRWHRYNLDGSWTQMPDPGNWAHDTPAVAVHQDKLWLFTKEADRSIWAACWRGTNWDAPWKTSVTSDFCPVMASHNGSLEVLYRNPLGDIADAIIGGLHSGVL